jgi:hypothetical protein
LFDETVDEVGEELVGQGTVGLDFRTENDQTIPETLGVDRIEVFETGAERLGGWSELFAEVLIVDLRGAFPNAIGSVQGAGREAFRPKKVHQRWGPEVR